MSRLVDIEPYEDCRIVLNVEDEGVRARDLPTAVGIVQTANTLCFRTCTGSAHRHVWELCVRMTFAVEEKGEIRTKCMQSSIPGLENSYMGRIGDIIRRIKEQARTGSLCMTVRTKHRQISFGENAGGITQLSR